MSQDNHKKCIWSAKESDRLKSVTMETLNRFARPATKTYHVLPEHEEELRQFNRFFVQNARRFLGLIIFIILFLLLTPLIILLAPLSDHVALHLVGFSMMALGFVIYIYPFATPETLQVLGIKKSIIACRISGVLICLIGTGFIFRAFLMA
ncbi:hypothetical protein [Rhodohalobacter sp.]|uniref:hypothetical protein n=1 Tax=Rhodohalobacter sp. TaxID=1974210 RepID=UPI002ACD3AEF|nr:hypothetical protein [Rhodohalobacter sp.]